METALDGQTLQLVIVKMLKSRPQNPLPIYVCNASQIRCILLQEAQFTEQTEYEHVNKLENKRMHRKGKSQVPINPIIESKEFTKKCNAFDNHTLRGERTDEELKEIINSEEFKKSGALKSYKKQIKQYPNHEQKPGVVFGHFSKRKISYEWDAHEINLRDQHKFNEELIKEGKSFNNCFDDDL
eukprot:403349160